MSAVPWNAPFGTCWACRQVKHLKATSGERRLPLAANRDVRPPPASHCSVPVGAKQPSARSASATVQTSVTHDDPGHTAAIEAEAPDGPAVLDRHALAPHTALQRSVGMLDLSPAARVVVRHGQPRGSCIAGLGPARADPAQRPLRVAQGVEVKAAVAVDEDRLPARALVTGHGSRVTGHGSARWHLPRTPWRAAAPRAAGAGS
jgi:hypothetical protein